ncbi:MAG: aldo/keto reductase [Alphaproteobacteria bacterium]|nr:aldo/keto reductase [Alphaproteobacteria bacterium]
MKTRRFGRTGLQISELVFGGGWVGGILIHQDEDTKRRAIRTALDGGINWIDTAADYGQGQSELAIGALLADLAPAERPSLSTKVRLDLESNEDYASQIRRSLEVSLERLRMDRVALFQLHNPIALATGGGWIAVEEVLRDGGVADQLITLKDEGLVDHVGFTALGEAPSCIRVIDSGKVDTAQVYYNLLNPSAGRASLGGLEVQDFTGLIAACTRNDVGVMNIRTFAAGVLATDARHGREIPITTEDDLDDEVRRAHAVIAALGDGHGTRAQTAIRFSLAHPGVSCVVVGLAELSHLEEAIAAAEKGPLPASALAALEPVWEANFGL